MSMLSANLTKNGPFTKRRPSETKLGVLNTCGGPSTKHSKPVGQEPPFTAESRVQPKPPQALA